MAGISHSEGQGVGMLAAALFGDRAGFDNLAVWTAEKLTRAYDPLHSWRYRPGDANPVSDPNNATDGDLLIALALFTAADRWGEPGLSSSRRDDRPGRAERAGSHRGR